MHIFKQTVFILSSMIGFSLAGVFRTVPSNQESIEGESVTIPCAVSTPATCLPVLWYRPDQQVYIFNGEDIRQWVREKYPGKYSVLGNATLGEYSLRIQNVTMEDSGNYQCMCGPAKKRMELRVLKPPMEGYPQCTIEGGTTTLFAGDMISLTCISKGGQPPPSLTWYHNGSPSDNMAHYSMDMTEVRYITQAMPSHDRSLFICVEESPALRERRNCTVGPITLLSPLAMMTSLEGTELEDIAENYATMATKDGTKGISFTCGLNPNFTAEDTVQNTTWFVDGEPFSEGNGDFGLVDKGQTLYLKEDSTMKGEIEVSCQVHVGGRSLGNITRVVEIASPPQNEIEVVRIPDRPIIYRTDEDNSNGIDIRPLIILNACIIFIMLLLILVAVYLPKVCNCRSPLYKSPKHVRTSSARHANSRITELHFVQSEQCQNGVARCEGPHFYETPDKAQPSHHTVSGVHAPPLPPNHSSQEMQATFHVVVHSRNGGPVSQTIHQGSGITQIAPPAGPRIANVTPVNTSNTSNNNSGPACCLYAPVRKKSRGNVYTEESANQQAHYQRVTGPPRAADHLTHDQDENLHENPLYHDSNDSFKQHTLMTSPCSTLPSSFKLKLAPSDLSLAYSRTLPLTPLERKKALNGSVSCRDSSDDELDSLYANIASLEDICKQTAI